VFCDAGNNDAEEWHAAVERGERAVDALPTGLRDNPEAMAETIENNVRRLIIDEMAVNPKYYERMSELLDALIEQRRQEAVDYRNYLAKIVELTRRVSQPETRDYPPAVNSPARRALYDNLKDVPGLSDHLVPVQAVADSSATLAETMALAIDKAIREVKKADWRGNRFKEREVQAAIRGVLSDAALGERIFEIVKAQREY
jgi:type I restriction enzyme R subunit